jgi:DeoR/GlpR family transcriptional regulator of sugar metabolism
MFIEERHQEILKLLESRGRISIADIQEGFQVSVDSARRDLRILEEKGLLKRTHGGAIPLQKVGLQPPANWTVREIEEIDPHYDAIAKRACTFIQANHIIFLTSASVGFLMLKYLPRDIPFTVVTNSIIIADELRTRENVDVYIAGGKLRARGNCRDALAIDFVRRMNFDLNFITGAGFSAKSGLTNGTSEVAAFQQAVIENSRRNIALMPHNKVGFEGFLKVAEPSQFDALITDWDAVEEELARIQDTGVDVLVAEQEELNQA